MENHYNAKPGLEKALLASFDRVPVRPQAHEKVLETLANPDTSVDQLAAQINQDVGLTAHVLKMANSVVFSPGGNVSSTTQAVSIIGTMQLRGLVDTAWLFQMVDKMDQIKGFDPKSECEHALEVAMASLQLGEETQAAEELREAAFSAGLLHDVGKILMAVNAPEVFTSVTEAMEKRGLPRWQMEKEMLGFNHANIGGSLLQNWGMSPSIVNAVRWHHEPERVSQQQISALTLVHLADCKVRNIEPCAICKKRLSPPKNPDALSQSHVQIDLSNQVAVCHI
jgi:putative nucleotidyltransferase with HDIG domain